MNHSHVPVCLAVPTAIWTTGPLSANVGFGSFSSLLIADAYGNVLLVVGLVAFLVGLAGLWFVSRVTPKGTVLAIAIGIYVVSWLIDPGTVRELHGLVGFMRLLGFAGFVMGVIDLVSKRRPT